MRRVLISLSFAFCPMVLDSGAGLLQADATRRARRRRPLVAQPLYLGGLIVDGLGGTCTIVALRYLPVFRRAGCPRRCHRAHCARRTEALRSVLRAVDRIAIGACVLGLILAATRSTPAPPMHRHDRAGSLRDLRTVIPPVSGPSTTVDTAATPRR